MDKFINKIKLILQDKTLTRRILFVIAALAIFRIGASIPIPGVNKLALERLFSGNEFLGLLNIFSGGGLSNVSIMMLGVGPYITATIILQLLTLVFPALKELYHEEGEAGRRKFAQYSRLLTVPLAIFQGLALLVLLQRGGILGSFSFETRLVNVIVVTAGSILLMWIGELISEYGIGNGVSLIIFAGIIARLPGDAIQLWTTFNVSQIPLYISFLLAMIVIIAGVVIITEAERPIPITYAKRVRGMKVYGGISTYLPIRVNNAGVMPIIFALSILLFPQMIANFLKGSSVAILDSIAGGINYILSNSWVYGIFYFLLVFVFTYFYSAVTFDPNAISENLQKSGAFIPGVRPGHSTAEHIGRILYRLTLVGAVFLGLIAILPLIMRDLTGISTLAIGGTSLLIVVSVALEFIKQIDAQVTMREY